MESTIIISGLEVSFLVTFTGKVMFKIDGDYNKTSVEINKVTVVKWLLTQLKEAQSEYDELSCLPYSEDGYGELRYKAFSKLGFTLEEERLVWKR